MGVKTSAIKTDATEIWVDSDDILQVKILEGAEMNEEAFKQCFVVYERLCKNKRIQLVDATAYCTITEEGKNTALLTVRIILLQRP